MSHFINGFFAVLTSDVFCHILACALPVSAMGLALSIFCGRKDFEYK